MIADDVMTETDFFFFLGIFVSKKHVSLQPKLVLCLALVNTIP